MAAKTYTVVGRASVRAESAEEAEAVAFNSDVDWAIHETGKKARYALAAALLIPSPLLIVPKLILLAVSP